MTSDLSDADGFTFDDVDINTDQIKAAQKQMLERYERRLGYEVLGAYRAGFDILDVLVDDSYAPRQATRDRVARRWHANRVPTMRASFVPRHAPGIGTPAIDYGSGVAVDRIDVAGLTDKEIATIREEVHSDD